MKNVIKPEVDYREFRFSKLKTEKFSHLLLLLFWPLYGFMFLAVERLIPREYYTPVYCAIDDLIPFNELFIIPYWAWFVFHVGMIVYLGVFDVENFKSYMYFIIISYSVTIMIYLIWPTCQELRPEITRDNIFARAVEGLYGFDTNTNVCPSLVRKGNAEPCMEDILARFAGTCQPFDRVFKATFDYRRCRCRVALRRYIFHCI